jgi:hypothetical protein
MSFFDGNEPEEERAKLTSKEKHELSRMEQNPDDVIVEWMSHLEYCDVVRFCAANKTIRRLCETERVKKLKRNKMAEQVIKQILTLALNEDRIELSFMPKENYRVVYTWDSAKGGPVSRKWIISEHAVEHAKTLGRDNWMSMKTKVSSDPIEHDGAIKEIVRFMRSWPYPTLYVIPHLVDLNDTSLYKKCANIAFTKDPWTYSGKINTLWISNYKTLKSSITVK